jgi:hypothetical protein
MMTRRSISPLFVFVALSSAACAARSGSTAGEPSSPGVEEGLAAFETVRSVLQHPRCQNCHPAGDAPLQGDDGHVHLQNVLRGPEGRGMIGAECTTCHGIANAPESYGAHIPPGNVKGWHMPPPEQPMVFVGLKPGVLCEQIKDPAHNGGKDMAALREHLDDPLVLWGWEPGLGRAPVSVPRTTFIEAWETWARAGAPCPGP